MQTNHRGILPIVKIRDLTPGQSNAKQITEASPPIVKSRDLTLSSAPKFRYEGRVNSELPSHSDHQPAQRECSGLRQCRWCTEPSDIEGSCMQNKSPRHPPQLSKSRSDPKFRIIKYLRPPRLQNLTPADQTLLTGRRSCSSPHQSLTLQAIWCIPMPEVIQIFRRNQSASDVCLLIKTPSPRCRGGTATLQWPSLRVTPSGNSCRCFIEE